MRTFLQAPSESLKSQKGRMQQTPLVFLPRRRLQKGIQEEAALAKARDDSRQRRQRLGISEAGKREEIGAETFGGGF